MVRRMTRRTGGRLVPGLNAALITWTQGIDRTFHRRTACGWCGQLADLRAGVPVTVEYADIRALVGLPYPEDHSLDARTYRVRGDYITPWTEG